MEAEAAAGTDTAGGAEHILGVGDTADIAGIAGEDIAGSVVGEEVDILDMHDTVAADIVDMDAGEGSLENLADMEDTEV